MSPMNNEKHFSSAMLAVSAVLAVKCAEVESHARVSSRSTILLD